MAAEGFIFTLTPPCSNIIDLLYAHSNNLDHLDFSVRAYKIDIGHLHESLFCTHQVVLPLTDQCLGAQILLQLKR